jgi:hypothetical protein
MSNDTLRKETDAFVSFFSAFELPRTVATIVDLSDGAPLLQVLTLVYVFDIFPFPNIYISFIPAIPSIFGNKLDPRLSYQKTGL